MDSGLIVSKLNIFLHDSQGQLVIWLEKILPKVSATWWDDCVIASLSYSQREIAQNKSFTKLSDFDLAALLRITDKSWYDLRTVMYLTTRDREIIRSMFGVRNNWAHVSTTLPGKDIILNDLNSIKEFLTYIGAPASNISEINDFILRIESPNSIPDFPLPHNPISEQLASSKEVNRIIREKSLVYLKGNPQKRGIVFSVTELGQTEKYEVFIDGALRTFYTGQIEPVETAKSYNWVNIDTFRSFLTAYQITNPSAQNLYSLNSARIDFVPYQFRPALKIIHSDEPRILIADSVGVGKTIEAGLIIKELEARSDLERVLIICPRPLVAERKWELEMKRFDEEFVPMDGSMLREAISDTDRDGEWPIRYNKAIIPYSTLDSRTYTGETKKRGKSFGLKDLDPAPHFDLVIIDEAHHIRNGSMSKEKSFAYKCIKTFCDNADAVVMLTATPLQTSDNDLFTLLNLLRPDVVIDQKTFAMMSRPNEYISKCIRYLRTAEEGWNERAQAELQNIRKTQWGDNVIADNPLFSSILERLSRPSISREERIQLLFDVESLHSFATMINRTRRRDIQDFCIRRSHTIEVPFTPAQKELHDELLRFEYLALSTLHASRSVPFMMSTVKRQAASCIFGLAPFIRDIIERRFRQINDDPELDLTDFSFDESAGAVAEIAKNVLCLADNLPDEDPKFDQMMEVIKRRQEEDNNKIIIFSTFRHTLAYLKKKLIANGLRTEQIDGSVNDEQRYELKHRFELPQNNADAVDILLFTEVGSEGLDYQFCDMMINYDLPCNPMRIEQRIGRIDRRGQKSEAVNLYNMITTDTVDAEIYFRCLLRIGVFEKSIGECEEILGSIANKIEKIVVDTKLTEEERKKKLEQMADNDVRKIQELDRLEEEEKELFGFDLSEFTTTQEIRNAENPWLTPTSLQNMINHYIQERVGQGMYILGESELKTMRLSSSARAILREDTRSLPGNRNAMKRAWEYFLSGRTPTHSITFDADTAEKHRDSFFITALHPLAKQAAIHFMGDETVFLCLENYSDTIPEGDYRFSVYAWKYIGARTFSKLITICSNDAISAELPDILLEATTMSQMPREDLLDWSELEEKQIALWITAREKHKEDTKAITDFKIASLHNNHRNRKRSLLQKADDATEDSIRRMYLSEAENAQELFDVKVQSIKYESEKADIHTELLANGVIRIKRG